MKTLNQGAFIFFGLAAPATTAFTETILQWPNITVKDAFGLHLNVNAWQDIFYPGLIPSLQLLCIWMVVFLLAIHLLLPRLHRKFYQVIFGISLWLTTILLVWFSMYLAGLFVVWRVAGFQNWDLFGVVYEPGYWIYGLYIAFGLGLGLLLSMVMRAGSARLDRKT